MTDPARPLEEQATDWVARLASDQRTREDTEAFQAWLEASEDHRRAWTDAAVLWSGIGRLGDDEEARRILLRRPRPARRRTPDRRAFLWGGVGAATAAGLAAMVIAPQLGPKTFQTVVGERRRLDLPDGSKVLLNTDSVLRVRFTGGERRLFLDRGQAFFQVATDKARPFRVFVGHDEVRAIGTAFDVRRIGDSAKVTLEEGRVAIYHGADRRPTLPTTMLRTGQQAVLVPIEAPLVRNVDLRKTQAWRLGRLVLEDSSLSEAAAELNRYGGPKVVIADPRTADLRVSGVFHTDDVEGFVVAMTAMFPVRVASRSSDQIVLSQKSSAGR